MKVKRPSELELESPMKVIRDGNTPRRKTNLSYREKRGVDTSLSRSLESPATVLYDNDAEVAVPERETTKPSTVGETYTIVPVKNPYDMRAKYETAADPNKEKGLPTYRQILEQHVTNTKGQLDELKRQRSEVPVITDPTLLDIVLNPFGSGSAAPSKEMMMHAEELDGQIAETEHELSLYNGALDYVIMSEDLGEFATWAQEDQQLLREYIAWNPAAYGAMNVASGISQKPIDISGLYSRYGSQRVREMLESVERSQNADILEEAQGIIDELAEKGGYWNFLPSVAATLGSGFLNIPGIISANLNSTGRYSTSDPNQLGQILSMYANTVTEHNSQTLGRDILGLLEYMGEAGTLAQGEKGAPTNFQPQLYDALAGTKAQEVIDTGGSFLYKGTKSAADSLVRNYMGALAGGPAGKGISLGLAAVGSFGDSYNDATRKGATPSEAVALAVVDAGTEVLTEFIPLDDWWDLAKKNSKVATDLATDIFAHSGIEVATEEIGLIVTASAEYAILGERSEYAVLARNLMENSGYTREEAERAAFHAFLEDALETAAVSGISADLSIGGARVVESLTGRDGSGQTENGSGNTLPGTDIKFLLPTYQEMVAELESIGMSREEAETEILTITREVGEELGIGGTLTNGGIMEAEIFTQIQTLPQEGSSPKTDNPTPYFTSDIWTGELEGLWTETQTDLNMDVLTEGDVDPDIGENSALDLDTEPLRHEDVLQQYLEKDPTLSVGDIPSIADLNVDSVTDMEVVPKTKEQLISELAPKIQKTGVTPGRAAIAAQEMYAKAEERFGSDMDAVLESYQPGQNPRKFLDGFQNAYIAGKLGNEAALENSTAAAYLTEEQREMAYELGEKMNIYSLDNSGEEGIIGMYRNNRNSGSFAKLPERMSKKHIREIAREYDISLKGITILIDYNVELLKLRYTGIADPERIGRVIFLPNAFCSREELVRTLYHELIHVEQFKEYGVEHVQNNRAYFEKLAYEAENRFIDQMKKEGRL